MRRFIKLLCVVNLAACCAGLGLFTSGCASKPKADWNARIGMYTYDQAVTDLGPPDRSTKLADGTIVADWYQKQNSQVTFNLGTGFYGSHSAVGVGQSVGSGPSAQYLRLTIGPDGKLSKWERVNR
jgi:hypothetical protein